MDNLFEIDPQFNRLFQASSLVINSEIKWPWFSVKYAELPAKIWKNVTKFKNSRNINRIYEK